MPSKKGQDRLDRGNINFEIHTTESRSPRRKNWQNNAHLEGPTPKAIPSHAHLLKQQLDDVYRASRGREGVPRKMVKHFSESFDELYGKLLPGTAGTAHMYDLLGRLLMEQVIQLQRQQSSR